MFQVNGHLLARGSSVENDLQDPMNYNAIAEPTLESKFSKLQQLVTITILTTIYV